MLTNHVVPRSTAKNLYDLMNDFCEVVKQEPRRVFMPDVVRSFKEKDASVCVDYLHGTRKDGPACGTIGCIAGWMKVMTRTKEWTDADRKPVYGNPRAVLNEIERWFPGDPIGDSDSLRFKASTLFTTDFPEGQKYGTRAYGRHVIRNVRAFMKTHKTELLSLPVVRS